MAIVTRKQRQQLDKLLKRIRAAVEAGKHKRAKWLLIQWLRSRDAKRLAVRLACRQMPWHQRPDKSELDAIAARIDPWEGTDEVVLVKMQAKEDQPDDYRLTMDFGIKNRALQYLLLLALREVVKLHPNQYGSKGTHKAIQHVAAAMSEGYLWAIEFDIEDFYPSFSGKEVPSYLPLPKKVTEMVLIGEHLNVKGGPTLTSAFGCEGDDEYYPTLLNDKLVEARRGIPQGSAVSPLIAEALLAPTLHSIPKIGVFVAYADNILLLAKSKEDVVAMSKGLRSALQAHPVGPFQPKMKPFDAGQPIEFLGHKLTLKKGMVRIEVDDHNLQKFKCRVASELGYLEKAKAKLQPLTLARRRNKLEDFIRSWTAAFKLCNGIASRREHWLGKLKTLTQEA
jgi:Reverse transcriptase (RNA-dependent DNA polymerase)